MTKYLIEFDRNNCIGAGPCAAFAPENWFIDKDSKATFKKAELTEKELINNLKAAESCPVNVIHIYEYNEVTKKKGKKLV